jgi:hypothetical protein
MIREPTKELARELLLGIGMDEDKIDDAAIKAAMRAHMIYLERLKQIKKSCLH